MESVLNKMFNTYNLRTFQEFATEKKESFGMVLKPSATVI